jgi:hypothetical protein
MGNHLVQLLHAFFIGGNLRLQVRHVLLRIPAGVGAALQQRHHLGLAQHAGVDQQEVVDLHALLLDARGKRRHGAGRDAAHIGVVAARADIEQRKFTLTPALSRGERGKSNASAGLGKFTPSPACGRGLG